MKTRPTLSEDLPALREVLDGTELFPADMLAGMIEGFLSGSSHDDIWLTCEVDRRAVGFCYAALEQLTDGTWNMLAIAVRPECQGTRVGGALITKLEEILRQRGARIIIVDTSGADGFARTREFYRRRGYEEEARIRDYWAADDDKITFWKAL